MNNKNNKQTNIQTKTIVYEGGTQCKQVHETKLKYRKSTPDYEFKRQNNLGIRVLNEQIIQLQRNQVAGNAIKIINYDSMLTICV